MRPEEGSPGSAPESSPSLRGDWPTPGRAGCRLAEALLRSLFLVLLLGIFLLPARASAAEKAIRVGLFAPLRGSGEELGQQVLQGATLAVERVNRQGGVKGTKIELIVRDDASDVRRSLQSMRDLADKERCLAVIASPQGPAVLATMAIANEKQVPLLVPCPFQDITRRGNRWVFRVGPYPQLEAACVASFAVQELGWRRVALLYQKDESGKEGMKLLSQAFRRLGPPPAVTEPFDPADTDFTILVSKVLKRQPDGVAVWASPREAGRLVRRLREWGYRGVIVGPSELSDPQFLEVAGEASHNTVFASPLFSANRVPEGTPFSQAFHARYGSEPQPAAASGYDAIMLMAEALRGLTFRDRKSLRDSLAKIDNCELAHGIYSFLSSTGDGLKSLPLVTYLHHRLVLMRDLYRPDPRTLRP